jgi:hypothetical protein
MRFAGRVVGERLRAAELSEVRQCAADQAALGRGGPGTRRLGRHRAQPGGRLLRARLRLPSTAIGSCCLARFFGGARLPPSQFHGDFDTAGASPSPGETARKLTLFPTPAYTKSVILRNYRRTSQSVAAREVAARPESVRVTAQGSPLPPRRSLVHGRSARSVRRRNRGNRP